MPLAKALVGRQPIVDRVDTVIGYELLFRRVATSNSAQDLDPAVAIDGDQMTMTMFAGALGVGIERLTSGKTVFFNADRGVLTGKVPVPFPAAGTVVEVLESVAIDAEVLAGCRALHDEGYRLAADDFRWFSGADKLLEITDIVKIDIQATPMPEVHALIEQCRPFGVQLLAEKVETTSEYTTCRELGFDLFQGYLMGRPRTIAGSAQLPSEPGLMHLANAVLQSNADFAELEQILRAEPTIAYQLLQLATIGRLGETGRAVRSIREALVLMGVERMRGWISALVMLPTLRTRNSHVPTVLARARTVELLVEQCDPANAGYAFTVGMLSAFDLLLDTPRMELSAGLDIPAEVRADAFGSDTALGSLVQAVIAFERRSFVADGASGTGCHTPDAPTIGCAAAEAFVWAMQATDVIDNLATA